MRLGVVLRQQLPIILTWPLLADALGIDGAKFAGCEQTPLGVKITLHLRPPLESSRVQALAGQIATAYGVARVRVEQDPIRSDVVLVYLDRQRNLPSMTYPLSSWTSEHPREPLTPLPFGVADDGAEVTVSIAGHGALIGGIPGSGKSNAIRVLLSGLCLTRNTALWGIDPKRAELVLWRSRFSRLVLGHDIVETSALLEELLQIVHSRADYLSTTGEATLQPSPRFPSIVLVVDEWAEVGATVTAKERQALDSTLRRIVSLGRAVGVSAILATQRPTAETIDVTTRSLLANRVALRVGDRHQADAILGASTYDPSDLIGSAPGRALLSDGGRAKGIQVYLVTDEMVGPIVASGWLPPSQE